MKKLRSREELMKDLLELTKEISEFNENNESEERKLPIFAIFGEVNDDEVIGRTVMSGTTNLFFNLVKKDNEGLNEFMNVVSITKLAEIFGGDEDVE